MLTRRLSVTLHDVVAALTGVPIAGIVLKPDHRRLVIIADRLTAAELAALSFAPMFGKVPSWNRAVICVPQDCGPPILLLVEFPAGSATPTFLVPALTNGPLTAPASSTSGGNGIYAYGSSSLFPTNSFNATNYGVDVLFRPQLAA